MTDKNTFIGVQDSFINLSAVSNINILPNQNRIVYNFCYPILLTTKGESKIISDYQYDDFSDTKSFIQKIKELSQNDYINNGFIRRENGFINKSKISSFKCQEDKMRVIFNMQHSIEIESRKGTTIAPEFVYVNFKTLNEYMEFIEYLNYNLVK